MEKQQLLESLTYIQIKRGPSRPQPIDRILQSRMDYFLSRRTKEISTGIMGAIYGSDEND